MKLGSSASFREAAELPDPEPIDRETLRRQGIRIDSRRAECEICSAPTEGFVELTTNCYSIAVVCPECALEIARIAQERWPDAR